MKNNLDFNRPVLLIEDDMVDVMTMQRSFKELAITNPLVVNKNADDALMYLKAHSEISWRYILLDLNIPRMSGLEFLKLMKQVSGLKKIPVVILTTSDSEQDRQQAFELGASGYMVKPADYADFVALIAGVHSYWMLSEVAP